MLAPPVWLETQNLPPLKRLWSPPNDHGLFLFSLAVFVLFRSEWPGESSAIPTEVATMLVTITNDRAADDIGPAS